MLERSTLKDTDSDKDDDLINLGTGILHELKKTKETPLGIIDTFSTYLTAVMKSSELEINTLKLQHDILSQVIASK